MFVPFSTATATLIPAMSIFGKSHQRKSDKLLLRCSVAAASKPAVTTAAAVTSLLWKLSLLLTPLCTRADYLRAATSTVFGPNNCVSLTKSQTQTCVISTDCSAESIPQVSFAFVCINGTGETLRRNLHSYGMGGFEPQEKFDSGVTCDSCMTVDSAFAAVKQSRSDADASVAVLEQAAAIPKKAAPSPKGSPSTPKSAPRSLASSPALSTGAMAMYGPSACISTYLSTGGTCLIQTRCQQQEISDFNVGVTCVDSTGDFTRYLFGKSAFIAEEIFDTRLRCAECLGIGSKPRFQRSAVLPKALVQEVSALHIEVKNLRDRVQSGSSGTSTETASQGVHTNGNAAFEATGRSSAQSGRSGSGTVIAASATLPPRGQGPSVAVAMADPDIVARMRAAAERPPAPAPSPQLDTLLDGRTNSAKSAPKTHATVPAVSLPATVPKVSVSASFVSRSQVSTLAKTVSEATEALQEASMSADATRAAGLSRQLDADLSAALQAQNRSPGMPRAAAKAFRSADTETDTTPTVDGAPSLVNFLRNLAAKPKL
eukprot:TRINITY_DN61041_c0_g1_i1.p1 TRINITY_DN61041_c0_g1~~TRINITY_DN61041_c0_g1_i1.p1  ORF type:complete len:544 (-),score=92.90 TRINITY_DN61041_c0_g1_i1:69-1700(-)